MKKYYTTSEVANLTGIHPNTVRLYEKLQLIPPAQRLPNGYRSFTQLHIILINMARTAFQVEVLQNGLRKQAVTIIKTAAAGDYSHAIRLTSQYLNQIQTEKDQAEEALTIVNELLTHTPVHVQENNTSEIIYTRKEAADYLNITIDTLRNWELNGLFTAKRKQNGYRIYTEEDIQTLKVIRSLRCANYSLSSILRMLHTLSRNPSADIRIALETSEEEDDIVTACDHLLTSLNHAEENAKTILTILKNLPEGFDPF